MKYLKTYENFGDIPMSYTVKFLINGEIKFLKFNCDITDGILINAEKAINKNYGNDFIILCVYDKSKRYVYRSNKYSKELTTESIKKEINIKVALRSVNDIEYIKFRILKNYFDFDEITGVINYDYLDLKFLKDNEEVFSLDGDEFDEGWKTHFCITTNGKYQEFQFDYHPESEDNTFDSEQFEKNVQKLLIWIENPESYKIEKEAEKYNL